MNMNFINAIAALSMINENLDGYLEEYRTYVVEHKERVKQYADWLKKNLPELFNEPGLEDFDRLIEEHDESKFSEEEFESYAQRWFGNKEKTFEYEQAWKHHWQNNEHHPEYWLGEDMPYIYILEMICDWGSFGVKKGDYKELIDYYYTKARDDEEKNLSDNTKKIIEEILSKIEEVD
jgi:hypothetical protein